MMNMLEAAKQWSRGAAGDRGKQRRWGGQEKRREGHREASPILGSAANILYFGVTELTPRSACSSRKRRSPPTP